MGLVLVTGGSGFIAGHCILQLAEKGHEVRATVRSLAREATIRAALGKLGLADSAPVSFVQADLLADDGWAEAMAGVDVVLHVASPVTPGHVDHEDRVIVPAREGTLRVLRAARAAGVRRVVMTSAFHAVAWGHPHDDHVFTEADWTVLDGPGVDAYGRSKRSPSARRGSSQGRARGRNSSRCCRWPSWVRSSARTSRAPISL